MLWCEMLRRYSWLDVLLAVLIIAVLSVVISILVYHIRRGRQRIYFDNPHAIIEDCAPVVEWLEGEFRQKGRYPNRLPQQYDQVISKYPHGKYSVIEDGSNCVISIGEYGENGCEIYWKSKYRKWHIDA